MTWNDVTVLQWQQLTDLYTGEDDRDDLATPTIAILKNMTEAMVDSLDAGERAKILKEINFVHVPPVGHPVRHIQTKHKRYRCITDVRFIKAARYIESKHFAGDPNANIHRIAASMVIPQTKKWFMWVDETYDSQRHEEYANDLLTAPITHVLGSVVFFCGVYLNWMANSRIYLTNEMMAKGMTMEAADQAYQLSYNIMVGNTKQLWSQNMRESLWKRHII